MDVPGALLEAPEMAVLPPHLRLLLLMFSGWVNREQNDAIEYLKEENKVLREQLKGRRASA